MYRIRTSKLGGEPLQRARIAVSLGLVETALDVLQKSSSDLYGAEGVRMLAGLLVATGQAREALALLNRTEIQARPTMLGLHTVQCLTLDGKALAYRLPAHDWFQFLIAASTQLSDPDEWLAKLNATITASVVELPMFLANIAPGVSNQLAAEFGLGVAGALVPRVSIAMQREQLLLPAVSANFLFAERGDLSALRALGEIERNDRAAAARSLDEALADYPAAAQLRTAPLKTVVERYRTWLAR